MRGNRTVFQAASGYRDSLIPRLFPLSLLFLCGVMAGHFLASGAPASAGEELRAYFAEYRGLEFPQTPRMMLSVVTAYFRYPLLALLTVCLPARGTAGRTVRTGFLCALSAVFGFTLSFAAGCFAAAFGREGVPLAMAAMGIRCVVTLPCFLLLATVEPRTGIGQAPPERKGLLSGGIRGFIAGLIAVLRDWRVWLCVGALMAGICAEPLFTPRLVRLALARVFS